MAKSYKKYPIVKQEKANKKLCNICLRNLNINYSLRGSQYKKVVRNYWTWQYRWTLDNAIERYSQSKYLQEHYKIDDWINYWKRICYRK